jgi:glutamyl/glutaminyl-tRNA synthetase
MSEETRKKVVTRFPPSPTGFLHVGSVRTALFNYLFAKKFGGEMILRIEDTDKERSKKEFEVNITDSLCWLSLPWSNEKILRQSERSDVYKKYLEKLIVEGKAYVSRETPKEEGDRAEVVRFKNPNKKIKFTDLIRGEIEFDTTELEDFVIAKSLEEPLYHLAVVIDDFESGVTHVIRGEDGISNTPRQILIQEAIGAPRPIYAHLPLILAPDRSKLSKRKHGESVSINFYREKAYFPEAILNYLALLGWNPGDDREIFSLEELVQVFDLSKVQKGGAIFNIEKLNWFNKQYLQKLSAEEKLSRTRELILPDAKTDTAIITSLAFDSIALSE